MIRRSKKNERINRNSRRELVCGNRIRYHHGEIRSRDHPEGGSKRTNSGDESRNRTDRRDQSHEPFDDRFGRQ